MRVSAVFMIISPFAFAMRLQPLYLRGFFISAKKFREILDIRLFAVYWFTGRGRVVL